MSAFEEIVQTMIDMGLLELFFPWLLITSLTYGTLKQTDVFDEESVIGAVAVSVGFIALAGIYTFVPAGMFANFGAAIGFAIFGLLGILMMIGMTGANMSDIGEDGNLNPVAKLGIAIASIVFIGVVIFQLGLTNIDINSDIAMQIVTLIFVLLVIGFVTRGGGSGE